VKAVERTCGVDFDNTLVTYDKLLARIAVERGLIDCDHAETKKSIRDRLRQLPNGEIEWQRCQALLYGSRIAEAKLIEGVLRFFELVRQQGTQVYIISHKTEFSPFDNLNLRTAALTWMTANRFFESDGLGLTHNDVFFADSRQQKIDYIAELRCTHFIDDLEETLLEAAFPPSTTRILYEPGRQMPAPVGLKLMKTWQEISHYFFGTY
jgi:hypothetical protein